MLGNEPFVLLFKNFDSGDYAGLTDNEKNSKFVRVEDLLSQENDKKLDKFE